MAGKRPFALCCAPQPIARFVQLFPKLAIVFFLIHVTVIIYSFFNPSPHAVKSNETPPGVVDDKMKAVRKGNRIHANLNVSEKLHLKNDTHSKSNVIKSLLLKKIQPDGNESFKDRLDRNRHQDLQERIPER